jgi:surfeit locus 1 family protein
MLLRVFHRRWLLTTVLVLAAIGVMVRLGIWQLDRLEARRAFNTRVQAQLDAPRLDLNQSSLDFDLTEMEYRSVTVRGSYDHRQEVALRNQAWEHRLGVHLITPLRIDGSDRAILIDRGWIPLEDFESGNWEQFEEPGLVEINGVIRASQTRPDIGGRTDPPLEPGQDRLIAWNLMNVDRIDQQISHSLLPVYIQQAPDPDRAGLPYRTQPDLDLSEGPHLGYAGQWFLFALVLAVGYPAYIRRQDDASGSLPEPESDMQIMASH